MSQYTWVPVFEAVAQWLQEYEHRQPELIAILQKIGIENGLFDVDDDGNKVVLDEIGPFTFFAMFMKFGIDNRRRLFEKLIDLANLDVEPPEDFDGVPSAQSMKVWLFPGASERRPETLPTLWEVFRAGQKDTITDTLFATALAIKGTGFAKLTQCLFYAYPKKYLPIDSQTRPWLQSQGIQLPSESWTDYMRCLDQVRSHTASEFYQISREAWFQNQKRPLNVQMAREYLEELLPDSYESTTHIVAFSFPNRKMLALDPGLKTAVKVFVEDEPPAEIGLGSVIEYAPEKSRNHHLAQKAPSLAAGHRAYLVEVPDLKTLEALCNWYGEEDPQKMPTEMEKPKTNNAPEFPLNQILYGPPGTGKTYRTVELAVRIAEPDWLAEAERTIKSKNLRQRVKQKYDELIKSGRVSFTTFHQSFAYEDFIEGIRADVDPETKELRYVIEDGVFKSLCKTANEKVIVQGAISSTNLSGRSIWKMSLGNSQTAEAQEVFTECRENGYVLLGWGGEADFSGCDDYESVKDRYVAKYPNEQRDYAFRAVNTFKNEIKIGDLIVISDGNSRFQAIAEVTGEYRNVVEKADWFQQARDVKWLQVYEDSRPVSEIYSSRFTQMALYRLKSSKIQKDRLLDMVAATKSKADVSRPHLMIIDEINRGNIARIFGELITLIEPSKRTGAEDAQTAILPYSKAPFSVPSNVYVIGTMNTADKSLAQLDLALRRRFDFIEMLPEPERLQGAEIYGVSIEEMLDVMNQRVEVLLDADHQIGHTYFMELLGLEGETERQEILKKIFRNKILPLLQEYFFEDYERIGWVLNDPEKAREHQFIQGPNSKGASSKRTLSDLFGATIAGQLSDNRYHINKAAFEEPEAYRQIIKAGQ